MDENINFIPKCLNGKSVAFVNHQYFTPCCNIDIGRLQEFEVFGMLDDKFLIQNIEDFEKDVLNSPEWLNFYKILISDYNKVPIACKRFCSTNFKEKESTERIILTQL
jgi:hypothetical protein